MNGALGVFVDSFFFVPCLVYLGELVVKFSFPTTLGVLVPVRASLVGNSFLASLSAVRESSFVYILF